MIKAMSTVGATGTLVVVMFYFAHKEEATVAPRAGDGVKMGHAVGVWKMITQEYQWMRELQIERESGRWSQSAPLCLFIS